MRWLVHGYTEWVRKHYQVVRKAFGCGYGPSWLPTTAVWAHGYLGVAQTLNYGRWLDGLREDLMGYRSHGRMMWSDPCGITLSYVSRTPQDIESLTGQSETFGPFSCRLPGLRIHWFVAWSLRYIAPERRWFPTTRVLSCTRYGYGPNRRIVW